MAIKSTAIPSLLLDRALITYLSSGESKKTTDNRRVTDWDRCAIRISILVSLCLVMVATSTMTKEAEVSQRSQSVMKGLAESEIDP